MLGLCPSPRSCSCLFNTINKGGHTSKTYDKTWPLLAHKASRSLARATADPQRQSTLPARSPIWPSLPRTPPLVGAVVAPPCSSFPPLRIKLDQALRRQCAPAGVRGRPPVARAHLDARSRER
ncbi:hypothetical protein SORBI_3002G347200 [Sorghum bicolor]|uniref:Uncharacterized protein n=1 Tax=Sorghum bicolor TaxID=4558 RepID=A0A1B6QF31_SORBI|nr:hypothetical protein SORBI_3002G347200 [Sorghum bicolor]